MLQNAPICASLPTADVERARSFYGDKLGLPEAETAIEGGVFFTGGGGTLLRLYERPPLRTPVEHTVAAFLVHDLDEEMSQLRQRGVSFEEYDLPHLKTTNGVYADQRRGVRGAWLKDPDGNIIALTELPRS
jgi:catechol 2,3-dioxygenase-like lactoylglutathione lyase family enzyme